MHPPSGYGLEHLTARVREFGINCEFTASWEKPSFYENGVIVHVSQGQTERVFRSSEEAFHPVDGSSAHIHAFNSEAGLRITEETVLDCVRFFCAGIGPNGNPFVLVESDQLFRASDHTTTVQIRPFRLTSVDDGRFMMSATILYSENLFDCGMSADTSGMVKMLSHDGGIPVYRLNS
jgi:hypothetical protein